MQPILATIISTEQNNTEATINTTNKIANTKEIIVEVFIIIFFKINIHFVTLHFNGLVTVFGCINIQYLSRLNCFGFNAIRFSQVLII